MFTPSTSIDDRPREHGIPATGMGMTLRTNLEGLEAGLVAIVLLVLVLAAILIMDQFNVHVKEGVPRHKAMVAAATERFRPIVMITLAAVLGMLPLALGRGIGAEMRNGVGIASVGGILMAGVLTLVVMPILYDLCTRKDKASP